MKANLDTLIRDLEKIEVSRISEVVIKGVTNDSRKIEKGHLFVAIRGDHFDGHDYIEYAINQGAIAIVVDLDFEGDLNVGVAVIRCSNTRVAYASICSNWFNRPSEKLKVVGVTGTNGKTSVTSLLHNLFKGMGYKVGLISTVEILIDDQHIDASMTTPDAYALHDYFNQMHSAGCSHVFMEVSSHAIDQHRVDYVDFDIAVFTNITHDHLDYHGTFKNYIKAKKGLFDKLKSDALAIINVDDVNGLVMLQNSISRSKLFSVNSLSDCKAKIISSGADGMCISINDRQFFTRLVGRFNVYNLLAAFAVAEELLDLDEIVLLEHLSSIKTPKGRMELIYSKPYVLVDYAHTPDALDNVLSTISYDYSDKLIVVIGCGGDRDKAKRPIMAKVAVRYADRVILTSDNPRSEDPIAIINDMLTGVEGENLSKIMTIVDRRLAIRTSIEIADKNDVILIAGKGHEEYQEISGVKYHFSDQEEVRKILSKDI